MTMWRSIVGWVSRALLGTPATYLTTLDGSGAALHPEYPAIASMATMARFPWVWTCVRARSGDLAGLPICAVRYERKPNGKYRRVIVPDDPALLLLQRPSRGVTGYQLRKQLVADYTLTGNAYVWRPSPVELIRLHPSHVTPVASPGLGASITSYRVWDGTEYRTVPAEQIIHIRDISWSDQPAALLGESPIRCLHDDLSMELGSKRLAAEQASKGRPEILMSTEGQLGPNGADELVEKWETARRMKHGAFAHGRGVKVTSIGWSPREFEFAERSATVRDTVLAVFEVPPARAGISSSAYGSDKAQMRVYWESLRRTARAIDEALTLALAQPGVELEHDFTDVEALQVSYTERWMRVSLMVGLGASPREAAEYEGFDEAPVPETVENFKSPRPIDRQPEEPQDDREPSLSMRLRAALSGYLGTSAAVYAELGAAVRAGADATIALRVETERLYGLLDDLLDPATARWWAEEVTAQTLEAVRIADPEVETRELAAFAPERAARIAARIERNREAA